MRPLLVKCEISKMLRESDPETAHKLFTEVLIELFKNLEDPGMREILEELVREYRRNGLTYSEFQDRIIEFIKGIELRNITLSMD